MPVPVAVWTIIEAIGAAITIYEVYDLGETVYGGIENYKASLDEAKEKLREIFQSLEEEINKNIDKKTELMFLRGLEKGDIEQQSEKTKKALGRLGEGGNDIRAAIKQTIPFRELIGKVCEQANKIPVFSVRKKKGVNISDLPKAKKEAMARLLSVAAESLEKVANIDFDDFIAVRLKQLAANLIFEFVDDTLGWKSPLKAEACFQLKQLPDHGNPPKVSGSPTRLYRAGHQVMGHHINPFYPLPIPEGSGGVISADLAIPDYRNEPLEKKNLFAIIEIKFKGDSIKDKQFQQYNDLAIECGFAKTGAVTLPRTNGKSGVTKGCRVALFRYPEDVAIVPKNEPDDKTRQSGQGNRRRRNNR
jgi:hypothetical protein